MLRKIGTTKFGSAFTVHTVPVLKDNFSYVIHDHSTNTAAVVDVSEMKPVIAQLQQLGVISPTKEASSSTAAKDKFVVLTTHKHWDHSGGNKDIARTFGSDVLIYGGAKDNVPHCNRPVNDNDEFAIGNLKVRVLFSPCHTSGHVLYHVTAPADPSAGSALFSGDTLFVGGIGAFFEGNAKDMVTILDRVATELPKDTKVFCGHEYTVNFIKFALTIDPNSAFIKAKLEEFKGLVAQGIPTIPSTIADELQHNVFMRTGSSDAVVRAAVGMDDKASAVAVMEALYNACP